MGISYPAQGGGGSGSAQGGGEPVTADEILKATEDTLSESVEIPTPETVTETISESAEVIVT